MIVETEESEEVEVIAEGKSQKRVRRSGSNCGRKESEEVEVIAETEESEEVEVIAEGKSQKKWK